MNNLKYVAKEIPLDKCLEILETKLGRSTIVHAELLEYYFSTAGFDGYETTYIREKTEGTIAKIGKHIKNVWLPKIRCNCDRFAVFQSGLIRKRWNIDLKFGWDFMSSRGHYYIKFEPLK